MRRKVCWKNDVGYVDVMVLAVCWKKCIGSIQYFRTSCSEGLQHSLCQKRTPRLYRLHGVRRTS